MLFILYTRSFIKMSAQTGKLSFETPGIFITVIFSLANDTRLCTSFQKLPYLAMFAAGDRVWYGAFKLPTLVQCFDLQSTLRLVEYKQCFPDLVAY